MTRKARHSSNPYSRRLLCQRCHKSPARYTVLSAMRLCRPCKEATFGTFGAKTEPRQLHLFEKGA